MAWALQAGSDKVRVALHLWLMCANIMRQGPQMQVRKMQGMLSRHAGEMVCMPGVHMQPEMVAYARPMACMQLCIHYGMPKQPVPVPTYPCLLCLQADEVEGGAATSSMAAGCSQQGRAKCVGKLSQGMRERHTGWYADSRNSWVTDADSFCTRLDTPCLAHDKSTSCESLTCGTCCRWLP
jgi:hypothetical protein